MMARLVIEAVYRGGQSQDPMSNISVESQSSSIGWISCSNPRDCFAPETMVYKHMDVRNLEYELVSAMSLQIGDKVKTANHSRDRC